MFLAFVDGPPRRTISLFTSSYQFPHIIALQLPSEYPFPDISWTLTYAILQNLYCHNIPKKFPQTSDIRRLKFWLAHLARSETLIKLKINTGDESCRGGPLRNRGDHHNQAQASPTPTTGTIVILITSAPTTAEPAFPANAPLGRVLCIRCASVESASVVHLVAIAVSRSPYQRLRTWSRNSRWIPRRWNDILSHRRE